jgi:Protein of unknown function (DUF5661)
MYSKGKQELSEKSDGMSLANVPQKLSMKKEFAASTDATMMGGLAKRVASRDMIDQYNLGFGPVTKKAEEAANAYCDAAPNKMSFSNPLVFNSPEYEESQKVREGSNMADQARNAGNVISGGKADYQPDHKFPSEQLEKGMKVEMEHTSNKEIAKEIAKDHLVEDMRYYDKLAKVHKD